VTASQSRVVCWPPFLQPPPPPPPPPKFHTLPLFSFLVRLCGLTSCISRIASLRSLSNRKGGPNETDATPSSIRSSSSSCASLCCLFVCLFVFIGKKGSSEKKTTKWGSYWRFFLFFLCVYVYIGLSIRKKKNKTNRQGGGRLLALLLRFALHFALHERTNAPAEGRGVRPREHGARLCRRRPLLAQALDDGDERAGLIGETGGGGWILID
jgi:hypothetical protein